MLLLLLLGAFLMWTAITYAWLAGFPEKAALKELYTWLANGGFWLGVAAIIGAVALLIFSIRRDNAATRAARQRSNQN
ncbi:hypothetical protein HBA54_09885 [Pelagibius litoralis]|uniref:Uncharacterized protein n=1 Tax=Pelagibius litoralis TaxID=374515 RepID=A0A967C975_9PROT|nr:hypothetical protein [Pelagibius litoralis]NIA68902.1 hypothetical protein [Pelagibius litoralis]